MRGHVDSQDMLVSYVSPESRGPAAHPLRRITAVAETRCCMALSAFAETYSTVGAPLSHTSSC